MSLPLGRQDSIISMEKYAKLWHGPSFVTWAEGLSTETVGEDLFLAKNWTKFEWVPLSQILRTLLAWCTPILCFNLVGCRNRKPTDASK